MSDVKTLRRQWVEENSDSMTEVENIATVLQSPVENAGIIYRGQEQLYPNWGNRSFSSDYEVASRFSEQYGGGVIYITKTPGILVSKWHEEDALKYREEKEVIISMEALSKIEWDYYHVSLNPFWELNVCINSHLSLKEVYQDLLEKDKGKFDPNELLGNILDLKNPKKIYPASHLPDPVLDMPKLGVSILDFAFM